jgi:signal transduction histidine kinase
VDSVRDEVEVIREAAVQADALIQDLLDVARIEAGRLRIDPGPEDVAELVGAALDVLAPLAAERGVELRRTLGSSLPDACVDSQRIHQAISNLVGNAIKFTPGGGCVTVSAQRAGAEVLVRVVDTGPGIPPEHLPHLFDRYWQGTRPTRRGAGLGLPITKGIVEAHRGRIWVESTPGQGSTFSFTLPLRPPGGDCSPEPSLSGNP